jgi:prepilin-type N-terminal cleavage/methylation domain-containing protein
MRARLRRLVRDERGFTLVELMVTMIILGVVIGGLTTTFASATTAHMELSRRFEAQSGGRLALTTLRREAHCASAVTLTSSTLVTLTLPSGCPTGSTAATWCVRSGSTGNELYRIASSTTTCTGGVRWAEYVDTTSVTVFSLPTVTTGQLDRLRVVLPIDLTPGTAIGRYALEDDIALRNSSRT